MSVFKTILMDAGLLAGARDVDRNLARNIPVALELAADMVAAEAKENHEYVDRSGDLTRSIAKGPIEGSFQQGTLAITVGAGAPHGAPIEEGSKPHVILPRHRKALRFPVEGGFVFAAKVKHPGNKAYKFLANALERKSAAITTVFEDATALSFVQAGFEVD